MPFIRFVELEPNKFHVNSIVMQTEILSAEDLQEGLFVDRLPDEPSQSEVGKGFMLFVNPETGDLWYEEVTRALQDNEKLAILETENEKLRKLTTEQEQKLESQSQQLSQLVSDLQELRETLINSLKP